MALFVFRVSDGQKTGKYDKMMVKISQMMGAMKWKTEVFRI